ncbi:MAG: DUF420 domain-containing protein [Cytophagales bacterium]|nr:MAG: DUF420 domain-containing protein [Cytophagales bacterium]TAF62104.1 MAG: DUF420 domain-containing protein [Cytophagales bacterium]
MTTLTSDKQTDRRIVWLIGILSIAVPLVVAVLLFMPKSSQVSEAWVLWLPHLNATLNSATAVCLMGGYWAVKSKNIELHRTFMFSAFTLSSLFLISYVLFHYAGPKTFFGDINNDDIVDAAEKAAVGAWRYIYLVILITHIILAAIIVPLVLFTVYYAVSGQLDKHRRLAKWTFPTWLYVAVTGVVVYALISSYYA